MLVLLLLCFGSLSAQPRLRLIPQNQPVLGSEPLNLMIVLDSESGGDVALNALEFDLMPSTNGFRSGSTVSTAGSWMGSPTELSYEPTFLPTIGGGTTSTQGSANTNNDNGGITTSEQQLSGPSLPVHVRIARNDLINVLGHGQCGALLSIMTIDELEHPPVGECASFSIEASNILLFEKDAEGNDLIHNVPSTNSVVQFCPKCEITDFRASVVCDNGDFYAQISYTGDGSGEYYIDDHTGNGFPCGNQAYVSPPIGAYPQGTPVTLSLKDLEKPEAVCSTTIWADCSYPLPESCNDHINNGTEQGVDCGFSCGVSCLACGLLIEPIVTAISPSEYRITLQLSNFQGNVFLSDGNQLPPQQGFVNNNASFVFGPYAQEIITTITVQAENDEDCIQTIKKGYQNASSFMFTPSNDARPGAIPLPYSSGISNQGPFDNYGGTSSGSDPIAVPCFNDGVSSGVWYRIAGTGGVLTISTNNCGGGIIDYENDLQMAVYTGLNSNTPIACSDDAMGLQPSASFESNVGEDYYILIDGYGEFDATGRFCINICEAPKPTVSTTPVSCLNNSDGTLSLSLSGGVPPYSYQWSNGATGSLLTNLDSGSYGLTISGADQCSNSSTLQVPYAPQIELELTALSQGSTTPGIWGVAYYDQLLIEVINGTPPFSYQWDNNGYVRYSIYEGRQIYLYASDAATWSLTVSDALGCQQNIHSSNIQPPVTTNSDVLNIAQHSTTYTTANQGSIDISVVGGVYPYTYQWSTGASTADVTGLAPGWYSVTVSDAVGNTTVQWYWVHRVRRGRGKTEQIGSDLPNACNALLQSGTLLFDLPQSGNFSLSLSDMNGRVILHDHRGQGNAADTQEIILPYERGSLPVGIYFFALLYENGTSYSCKVAATQ